MKGAVLVAFGVGYVAGTRAGRERYRQILDVAHRMGDTLERYATGGAVEGEADRADGAVGNGRTAPVDARSRRRTTRARRDRDDGASMPDLGEFDRLADPGPLLDRPRA